MVETIKKMREKKEEKKEEKKDELSKNQEEDEYSLNLEEMEAAGLYFGHRSSRTHPKMTPYILGIRNTVHIIDLEQTLSKFREALKFIEEVIRGGGVILFVGTKPQYKNLVAQIAQDCGLPYINERWLGGTLTNFKVIRKRIDYLLDLEQKQKSGELEKYTKKEKAKINQEIARLKIKFEGIKNLTDLPQAIFVVDMKKDKLAVKEARMKGVKVVAISDTNVDPTLADYPIPANDDAISSVKYILEKVKEVILKAKSKA